MSAAATERDAVRWPDAVDGVLAGNLTAALAYVTPAGGAVVMATTRSPSMTAKRTPWPRPAPRERKGAPAMTTPPEQAESIEQAQPDEAQPVEPTARDAANWAHSISGLQVGDVPAEAINRNVEGKRVLGPMQGFGKMWQKTYRVRLYGAEVAPTEVIAAWKRDFGSFWPEKNHFYGPLTGIAPGDVAVLNLAMPGRVQLSTGIFVMYADDESFTFMAPEGHMFAGWITFSAFELADDTMLQVQVLMRAGDPLSEVGMTVYGHKEEDRFWCQTLRNVAAAFGVEGDPETEVVCVDRKRQWRRAGNIRHSATIRSGLYAVGAPFRRLRKGAPTARS